MTKKMTQIVSSFIYTFNHNGVNSLNFSPETGKLVLTTGDGESGYDPFNLSQDDMEIADKIIEINVAYNALIDNPPVVTRFVGNQGTVLKLFHDSQQKIHFI